MAHYRVSESKREQFRRYLEKAGVLESLTNVLVALYEETEKPNNALEYPYTAAQPEPQPAIAYCFLFQKRHAHPYDEGEAL